MEWVKHKFTKNKLITIKQRGYDKGVETKTTVYLYGQLVYPIRNFKSNN